MQLTDERSLELFVITVKRLSGGTRFTEKADITKGMVFVTRINHQHTVMPSEQPVGTVSKEVEMREDCSAKSASNPSSVPAGSNATVA